MKLERPLCCLDTETTGVDPVADRLIEFGVVVYGADGSRKRWEQRFNPGMHIPEGATAVHGITDEDVANCPPFSEWAAKIHRGLQGRDIAGFNVRSLDLPILDEEMRRCGLKLDISGARVIDAFAIYQKKRPRTLAAAVEEFCGRTHTDAHGAGGDADATLDVLFGQFEKFEDLAALSLDGLSDFCIRDEGKRPVDLAGKLYRGADGFVRYAFSKNKDVRVIDDPGFGRWMLQQTSPGFPGSTCDALRAELGLLSEK